jgi:hypothetical protein
LKDLKEEKDKKMNHKIFSGNDSQGREKNKKQWNSKKINSTDDFRKTSLEVTRLDLNQKTDSLRRGKNHQKSQTRARHALV